MNIASLAASLFKLEDEITELELDMFSDSIKLKDKEEEKKQILNDLLFFDEFKELYENNDKLNLDNKLLYPFKKILNEFNETEYVAKSSEEYKEDVSKYLEDLQVAFENGSIDKATFIKMKEDAIEIANRQMDKIEEEEKEKENELDLNVEYKNILKSVNETKEAFIINQIGEDTYPSLCYKYKDMTPLDRKILLSKTHQRLCVEMGVVSNIDFTKYDMDCNKSVTSEGYYIQTKDINQIPYPLDLIILEQTYKLHIQEVLRNTNYTPKQKNVLKDLLAKNIDNQKEMFLSQYKKREITPYGC